MSPRQFLAMTYNKHFKLCAHAHLETNTWAAYHCISCVCALKRKLFFRRNILKIRAVYISFSLLVAYSISSYFAPEYIADNVLRLHETREQSEAFSEELIKVIQEADEPLNEDMAISLVTEKFNSERARIDDTYRLVDLLKSKSLILFGLLLIHISVLVNALRSSK